MKLKSLLFFFSIFFSSFVLAESIPANPKEMFFIERAIVLGPIRWVRIYINVLLINNGL